MREPGLVRRMPRWLGALPLSLVLHAVILLAVVSLVRREESLPALIIDLNAIVAEAGDEAGDRASGAAGPGPRAARPEMGPARRQIASAPPSPEARAEPSQSSAPASSVPSSSTASSSPAWPATPSPPPPSTDRAETPAPSPATTANPSPGREAAGPSATTAPSPDRSSSPIPSGGAPQGTGNAAEGGRGRPIPGNGSGSVGASGGDRLALAIPGEGGLSTEYSVYLARLRTRLQQALRYPPSAQRRGITGTVQLEIGIEADGAVSSVELATSSSHDALDRAALDAARSLPRQPFPADVRARPLTVRVPVTFKLQ